MITTKENIIQYFQKGIKNKDNLKIGVEHEKFIFNKSRKRVDYQTICKNQTCSLPIHNIEEFNEYIKKNLIN